MRETCKKHNDDGYECGKPAVDWVEAMVKVVRANGLPTTAMTTMPLCAEHYDQFMAPPEFVWEKIA